MASSKSKQGYRKFHSNGRVIKKYKKSSIESLPRELLIEVIAKAAASSFTAFFSAKQSSKMFMEVADDSYIYRNMKIERCPMLSWRQCDKLIAFNTFWERCINCGNSGALFLQGVVDYFGLGGQEDSGLVCLNQAAELGHNGARYTLGIILLLSDDDELNNKGIQFLCDVKKSNTRLITCRMRLKAITKKLWTSNKFRRERSGYCIMGHKYGRTSGWESEDEDDIECDACQCEREVASFCHS